MNVLFLAPPMEFDGPAIHPRHVPIYAAYAAAYLEKHGHTVSMMDAFLENLNLEQIRTQVSEKKPDLLVLVPFDYTRETPMSLCDEIAEVCKHACPEISIGLIGSPKQTLFRHALEQNPFFDFAIYGECEQSLLELVDTPKEQWTQVPGVMIRKDAQVLDQGAGRSVSTLDELPYPAWHLLDFQAYTFIPHRYKYQPFYPIMASRRCPYHCKFCPETPFTAVAKYRERSVESVIAEIEDAIQTYGAQEIQFMDPTFGMKSHWVEAFCDALDAKQINIPWSVVTRVDVMNRDILQRMSQSGCWNVLYGIESGQQRTLDLINKKTTLSRVKECVQETRDAGLQSTLGYMIGLPGESENDIRNTIQFAIDVDSDYASFFLFKYYTDYDEFDALGYKTKEWDMAPYEFRGPLFVPQGLNPEKLRALQKQAMRRFYFRPKFIWRHLPELLNPKQWGRYLKGGLLLLKMSLS